MFENSASNGNESDVSLVKMCKYCTELVDPYTKPGLLCDGECGKKIHIQCLPPGRVSTALVGDVFFDLICKECSGEQEEITRSKISWFKVVVLTLYNLRERSNGISRRGYFHWKSDIVLFIDRNWDNLFQKFVKRKKNWIGTISGTLSHYSNIFFKSGTSDLGESGWWKLIDNDPPEVLAARNDKAVAGRKNKSSKNISKSYDSPAPSESSLSIGEDSNFSLDTSRNQSTSAYSQAYVQPTEILSDFLLAEDELQDIDSLDIEDGTDFSHSSKIYEPSLADLINNFKDDHNSMNDMSHMTDTCILNNSPLENFNDANKTQDFDYNSYEYSSDSRSSEDISCAKNVCQSDESNKQSFDTKEESMETTENNQEYDTTTEESVPPSLFNASKRREWPWKKKILIAKSKSPCRLMSVPEEEHLLKKFEKYKHCLNSAPPNIRRLYRKLVVRKWKRENNLPIFDIDKSNQSNINNHEVKQKNNVLDWFTKDNIFALFEQRLQGCYEPTFIYSPHTQRKLRPFIRRDTESSPVWLNVMQELLEKTNKNNPDWLPPPRAPIDYSYVRPQHIPAINSLCHQFFWPGIDLTDCLQYPDFTCVVLYKKLVIGFAVMVPDVVNNEAYISFILTRPEWRNAKIGTFMLYHLIQTCMGKDITLHVSASNPAVFLYEKFGFKVNEFVHNFYDKYMPPNSRESRHALFLRLSR